MGQEKQNKRECGRTMSRTSSLMAVVALLVLFVAGMIGPVVADVTLEAGAGLTLTPIRGADVGPFVALNVYRIPDKIPILGASDLFLDFGVLDGQATVGPAISITADNEDTRFRIGISVWREARRDSTVYLRYGVPFTF